MSSKAKQSDDVHVQGRSGDSVFIVTPVTEEAQEWVKEHIPDDAQWFGKGFVVEHRYLGNIIDGMIGDGLTISNL